MIRPIFILSTLLYMEIVGANCTDKLHFEKTHLEVVETFVNADAVRNLNCLIVSDGSESHLLEIYREGNVMTQLYALIGLKHINYPRLEELTSPLKNNQTLIRYSGSDYIRNESVSKIVHDIENGIYDIYKPNGS